MEMFKNLYHLYCLPWYFVHSKYVIKVCKLMDFIMLDMWKEQNAGFECVCMCVLLQAGGKRELLGKKGGGGRRKKGGWRKFSPEDEEGDDLEHGRLERGGQISEKNGEEERRFIYVLCCCVKLSLTRATGLVHTFALMPMHTLNLLEPSKIHTVAGCGFSSWLR